MELLLAETSNEEAKKPIRASSSVLCCGSKIEQLSDDLVEDVEMAVPGFRPGTRCFAWFTTAADLSPGASQPLHQAFRFALKVQTLIMFFIPVVAKILAESVELP